MAGDGQAHDLALPLPTGCLDLHQAAPCRHGQTFALTHPGQEIAKTAAQPGWRNRFEALVSLARNHLPPVGEGQLPGHALIALPRLARRGGDHLGNRQPGIVTRQLQRHAILIEWPIGCFDPPVIATRRHIEAAGTDLNALLNQAAMQFTAGMQGHGMLPDLRPVRHRQRIARPEVLIDRELAGQPRPVRAQGGVDLQGMHR